MGIFGALTTAVTGMRAQSFALENVSGNIANSQTTAFKRMDTSFVDLIPDASALQAARRQRGRQCADDQHGPGRRPVRHHRDLHGDQRRRVLRRAEAVELHRQPAGLRRHRPLHPARRLPARQERLPGQRRRLLSDGHSGRSVDRQPGRQRPDAAAVPERLPAGAGHHADRVSRQSRRPIRRRRPMRTPTFRVRSCSIRRPSPPIRSPAHPSPPPSSAPARNLPTSLPACPAPARSRCPPRRSWASAWAARCGSR